MVQLIKPYKFSGRVPEDNAFHQSSMSIDATLSSGVVPPIVITVPGAVKITQYAPTVFGDHVNYDPRSDCDGSFTSAKFQIHNNCYNYACNIATNSFAQPGRMKGFILEDDFSSNNTIKGAELDGLILVSRRKLSSYKLRRQVENLGLGHCVALLTSDPCPEDAWPGDYHFVRCDDPDACGRWSQKDGGDQVTNFDFLGDPIVDPARANWEVNQGPLVKENPSDIFVRYKFLCYMFVRTGAVEII